jgi:hypothetical protein
MLMKTLQFRLLTLLQEHKILNTKFKFVITQKFLIATSWQHIHMENLASMPIIHFHVRVRVHVCIQVCAHVYVRVPMFIFILMFIFLCP